MDVDRLALDRPLVGEDLHAVDQLDDAVGLVADQPGQRAVLVADRGFEQLRRAADAGERILDLVRQHGGEPGDRARRAAMGELAVDLVGHRALLEHDDHAAPALEHRRGVDVDDALAAVPRRADIDAVLVDRRAALAHLVDQRQERAAEGHEIGERMAAEHVGRGLEEALGRGVRFAGSLPVAVDERATGCGSASRSAPDSASPALVPAPSGVDASCGLPAPRFGERLRRSAAGRSPAALSVSIAVRRGGRDRQRDRSRYQPRCLRAQRGRRACSP